MRKYSPDDQRAMATWVLDCAERVLPTFEAVDRIDLRPRRAIETWARVGKHWAVQHGCDP